MGNHGPCRLVDDGTLDTVISTPLGMARFTELLSGDRDKNGALTTRAFNRLRKEALDILSQRSSWIPGRRN